MKPDRAERNRRYTLTFDQQMREAEASCVPCKLCGGKAVISDAGPGYGYNINCEHWMQRRNECFQGGTRISGWAYNVADRWNELNAIPAADARPVQDDAASRRRKIMGHMDDRAATDARAEALLKRAAQMAYEVWDDPEALAKAILALIPETKP